MTQPPRPIDTEATQAFITRWSGSTASELATAQSFVIELCALLGAAPPHATAAQDYMFERPVTFQHGKGSTSTGRIDCYRRGHFVLEAKKLKAGAHTKNFDENMLRARSQAENYARALPAGEGRPPFVLVVDVGTVIEVYSEFSRTGGTYLPFPDPQSNRLVLADLLRPEVQQRLHGIWHDPLGLDPARTSAQVTRGVAALLARLARSLEGGNPGSTGSNDTPNTATAEYKPNQPPAQAQPAPAAPETVAAYLTRCLFCMFAEDVALLPEGSFQKLLETHRNHPATLQHMLRLLWADMDTGGFSAALARPVLHFNGKLFKGAGSDGYSLLLTPAQIDLLIEAAKANWREVEPAIFGTLLERALDPTERHALGAHYTPRAYVERLVLPTVVEPLRAEWANTQAAALVLAHEAAELEAHPPVAKGGTDAASFDRRLLEEDQEAAKRHAGAVRAKWREASQLIKTFHHRLCTLRVLDPACGSGNFLYVTLEHLKRLEGEVLNQLGAFGDTQDLLTGGQETVNLQQLRGIELNERAAALAELVLWIGYLQWHIRTRGNAAVAEPVVHDYRNIECRDAVLAWTALEPAFDAQDQLLSRWDGVTFKTHPVTNELVPDEAAQVPQWRYLGARQAAWPQADIVVGNPPFIGASTMRAALGDGYVQALRAAWPQVPESADLVMYWWARAAALVGTGDVQRMGLITTNSLRQTFNRRVVQAALEGALSVGTSSGDSLASLDADRSGAVGGTGAGVAGGAVGLILSKAQKSAPNPTGPTHPSAGTAVGASAGGQGSPAGGQIASGGSSGAPGGHQAAAGTVQLVFAIPDHPWVDSADGAAVRTAMTVVQRGAAPAALAKWGSDPNFAQQNLGSDPHLAGSSAGRLLTVTSEQPGPDGEVVVTLAERRGEIHADLSVGANVTSAAALQAMGGISSPGVKLHGAGFIVTPEEAAALGHPAIIKDYRNGRDLTDRPRGVGVIDAFGLTADELRSQHPAVYQWLLERVKPERDAKGSSKDGAGYAKLWWLHGKPRTEMRKQLAGLPRYIATVETAKHRVFQFLEASILPDNMLIAIASNDAFDLGVLSSCVHQTWALATGGRLGVGNDPRYNKSRCFETFPFPEADTGLTPALRHTISHLAEQIDHHRKRVLGLLAASASTPATPATLARVGPGADFWAFDSMRPPALPESAPHEPSHLRDSKFPEPDPVKPLTSAKPAKDLTLTGLYNVLQALREGRALTTKEKQIHSAGLVGVLKTLHDELDAAVLQAYGWPDLQAGLVTSPISPEFATARDELLARLVALNAKRAAEEAQGQVRWLRPAFQNPFAKQELPTQVQQGLGVDLPSNPDTKTSTAQPWPATLPDQVKAVAQLLASSPGALTLAQIEARFTGRGAWRKTLPTLLQTLQALGRAQQVELEGVMVWRA